MAADPKTENKALKSKIEELNELIELQQYYIDEWREKYEEQKQENIELKQEIKRIYDMEQATIGINDELNSKDLIIKQQQKLIYHLQNPSKWQCDYEGYIWKDTESSLSAKIEKIYLKIKTILFISIINLYSTPNYKKLIMDSMKKIMLSRVKRKSEFEFVCFS